MRGWKAKSRRDRVKPSNRGNSMYKGPGVQACHLGKLHRVEYGWNTRMFSSGDEGS